jgi:hypothetical protein
LVGHWLIMGLKTDTSRVDVWLSKMEVAIDNIVSFAAVGNLVVNQLMECNVIMDVITKVTFAKEPK